MAELDVIRKKKLEELMRSQEEKLQQQAHEQDQVHQQIEFMETSVKQFLTKDALARYGNIKAAHNQKALHLLLVLYQAIQKGQIQSKIDDTTLKKILEQITPKRKEINIKRI